MNHQDTCKACDEAYKTCQVDALREAGNKAFKVAEGARTAYLNARDAYHKIYRELWNNFRP